MDKESGPGFGIFPDPDPGDLTGPDPTGSGSATLVKRTKTLYSLNVVHALILILYCALYSTL